MTPPIQAASLFLNVLEGRLKGEDTREVFELLRDSIEGMRGMLDSLLDMARLEAGAVRPVIAEFALDDVLRRLGGEFAHQAANWKLGFRRVPSGLWVRSDPILVERILRNLLANAVVHTANGRILFGCRRRPGGVEVQVWDTGPGIAPEHIALIFQEFRQLRGTGGAARAPGFGLGLAIVARLARLLGVTVSVRSRLGKGSLFAVTLPRVDGGVGRSGGAARLVLLAGVDATELTAIDAALQGQGLTVVMASSLADLSRAAHQATVPALVIADALLGGVQTGPEMADTVRSLVGRDVPVILLSADADAARQAEAAAAGYGLLRRPVQPEELRRAVLRRLAGV